jgi:hypothetical protein
MSKHSTSEYGSTRTELVLAFLSNYNACVTQAARKDLSIRTANAKKKITTQIMCSLKDCPNPAHSRRFRTSGHSAPFLCSCRSPFIGIFLAVALHRRHTHDFLCEYSGASYGCGERGCGRYIVLSRSLERKSNTNWNTHSANKLLNRHDQMPWWRLSALVLAATTCTKSESGRRSIATGLASKSVPTRF